MTDGSGKGPNPDGLSHSGHGPSPEVDAPAHPPDPSISVRLEQLAKETEPSFVKELVSQFLEEAQTTLQQLKAALQSGDSKNAGIYAHKLKGGSSNLGANRLARLFEQLENELRTGQSPLHSELMGQIDLAFRQDGGYLKSLVTAP